MADKDTNIREKSLPQCTRIVVAVYWPGEGYGGGTTCKTMEDARGEVGNLLHRGYGKSGKNPIHIVTKITNKIEIELIDEPKKNPEPKNHHGSTKGWSHFNPDTGMEWSKNHPVESGECTDAADITKMTLGEFRRRYPKDASDAG